MFTRRQGGFTLIELLIVLVLMAIIALLISARLTQSGMRRNQLEAQTALKDLYALEREYQATHGSWADITHQASAGKTFDQLEYWIPSEVCPDYIFTINETSTGGILISAEGNIDDDPTIDTWTINQEGTLTNTVDDVVY